MANKRIIFGIGALCVLAGAIGVFLIERPEQSKPSEEAVTNNIQVASKPTLKNANNEKSVKKSDLYSNTPYYVPLISITEISKLTPAAKKKVDEILEYSQGFYFVKYNENSGETTILLQNPVMCNNNYSRHNLQTATITKDGKVLYTNIGYVGDEGEIGNTVEKKTDSWEFDTSVEPNRPLKHITYDKKNKVMFTETWNYDDTEPVKYIMKNGKDKVVSILKETVDTDMNFRREHIFYDNEGNTVKTLSANYEGADIKWFTYYDAENPDRNITIENLYDNGLQVGENIYNQEFKPVNSIKARYANGERTKVSLLDNEGKEIESFEN